MSSHFNETWVYLSASPLLWLFATLLAYQCGSWCYRRSGCHPLINPVLIAAALLIAGLLLSRTPYTRYFDGAQFVHFLLGPATVALAVPLYQSLSHIRRMLGPLSIALLIGASVGVASGVLLGQWLGLTSTAITSLAPRSVTTPIAMALSESLGGVPSLTATFVMFTGIIGSIIAKPLFTVLRIHDPAIQGFALGLSSHGVGTARAFQLSETAGAFSGLAMGLTGLTTALLMPLLAWILQIT